MVKTVTITFEKELSSKFYDGEVILFGKDLQAILDKLSISCEGQYWQKAVDTLGFFSFDFKTWPDFIKYIKDSADYWVVVSKTPQGVLIAIEDFGQFHKLVQGAPKSMGYRYVKSDSERVSLFEILQEDVSQEDKAPAKKEIVPTKTVLYRDFTKL